MTEGGTEHASPFFSFSSISISPIILAATFTEPSLSTDIVHLSSTFRALQVDNDEETPVSQLLLLNGDIPRDCLVKTLKSLSCNIFIISGSIFCLLLRLFFGEYRCLLRNEAPLLTPAIRLTHSSSSDELEELELEPSTVSS